MKRRSFVQYLGATGSSFWMAHALGGCSQVLVDEPPVLGGDPSRAWWLRGNYAPVPDEIESFNLEIEGAIPPELNGLFLRNGANPGTGQSAHWFLGDGMLHGLRIANGEALWYRNRWVDTFAYQSSAGDDLSANRANTNVVYHANKLLALYEVGLPHEVSTDDLSTLREHDFDGVLRGPMTAHPKIDPITGEMICIGYAPFPPYLTYYVVDASGALVKAEEITINAPSMMHDFQLTQNHVIFFDLPIIFDADSLDAEFPFKWAPSHGARFGVMPRNGSNADVRWYDIDLCFMFHSFNAYEDINGHIVLEGCRLPNLWADSTADATQTPTPWRWILDPTTGNVSEGPFLELPMDFPIVDRRRQGLEHRLAYGLRLVPGTADYPTHPTGIVKHDHQTGETKVWNSGEAQQPDEALFIPASPTAPEGEGYLISMVYDRASNRSQAVILDASNVTNGPVARIHMPRRVPFGFHGEWISMS